MIRLTTTPKYPTTFKVGNFVLVNDGEYCFEGEIISFDLNYLGSNVLLKVIKNKGRHIAGWQGAHITVDDSSLEFLKSYEADRLYWTREIYIFPLLKTEFDILMNELENELRD